MKKIALRIIIVVLCLSLVVAAGELARRIRKGVVVSEIEQKVRIGMSISRLERALERPNGALARSVISHGSDEYYVQLVSGGNGLWTPRYRVILMLDKNKRVSCGSVQTEFLMDENVVPLRLTP